MFYVYSCQALVKRSVTLGGARGASGGNEETPPAPSIRRRPSSPTPPAIYAPPRRPVLAHNIQGKFILIIYTYNKSITVCYVCIADIIGGTYKCNRTQNNYFLEFVYVM